MGASDPREILANSKMGVFQVVAIMTCFLLNALDGFDVLAISFAAPGIAQEWGISRAALGVVLSMELIGMAAGSVLLGNIADAIGRRPTILFCVAVMAIGMALAATAGNVTTLSVYRFVTGLGIGGVLAAINAIVAEYSSTKRRALAVSIMAAGYPIGAIVGGTVASVLLTTYDWRSVFYFGAIVTFMFLPLVWILLPESVDYLMHRRPVDALARINKTLKRMGHQVVDALPTATIDSRAAGVRRLFGPDLLRTTLFLTVAYFAHIMTYYSLLKWIPKIVVDIGFTASLAGSVLVWQSVGGASGAILFGLLTQRLNLRHLVIGSMLFGSAMVVYFGSGHGDLAKLSFIAAAAGFFLNAAIVGFFAIFVISFPTEVRAGGTGFVIGIGRGGAALGPIVAGVLFDAGITLQGVAILMAAGSAMAAGLLMMSLHSRVDPASKVAGD